MIDRPSAPYRSELHAAIAENVRQTQGVKVSDESIETILESMTASVVDAVPGARYAGITLMEKGHLNTIAPTGPVVVTLDALQMRHGSGPCLEAAWEHHLVRVSDYAQDRRWPALLSDVVARTPVRCTVSFQLYHGEDVLGALNLHAERSYAFDADAEEIAMVFATNMALALQSLRRQRQFESALASRDIIGQAKGIIMERYNVDALHAFEMLKKVSQDTNVKLADLARRLVDTDHPQR